MGKRIQYIGTAGEKQPSCAFRTDFETKRYVYPLSFASLSRFPFLSLRATFPRPGEVCSQGDANPLRRYRASSPEGGAFTHLPVSDDKAPPSGELARRQA